jgi:hypothetical protein
MRGAGQPARPNQSSAAAPEEALRSEASASAPFLVRTFRRHLWAAVVVNFLLTFINAVTGGGWWAFWPLLATVFVLGVHYLLYKTLSVDEAWAQARVEELNLKSYDRSHIEDLKSRYADGTKRND